MARYLSRTALAVGRANDFAKQSVAADYQRTETLRGDRPVLREEWRNGGLLNHPMAPAIIETDPVSGLRVREEWYAFGERHREDLPAVIERDPQTGIVIGEDHWWHGRPRRPDAGIVSLARNARTQVVTVEVWQRPPEEGATYLWRDAATGITFEEHRCRNGLPHREGGPAVIRRDRVTGDVEELEWWREGGLIEPSPRPVRQRRPFRLRRTRHPHFARTP